MFSQKNTARRKISASAQALLFHLYSGIHSMELNWPHENKRILSLCTQRLVASYGSKTPTKIPWIVRAADPGLWSI